MKPIMTKMAQIGDVIMSPEFAKGSHVAPNSTVPVTVGLSYNPIIKPARAKAKYVVEKAEMDGGGTGHGPGDVYPDGWEITARKLRPDGTYNPKGEVIRFYQSGAFNCVIEQVEVVGKLKKVVDFV